MIIKSNKNVYKNYFGEDGISKIYAGENLVFGKDDPHKKATVSIDLLNKNGDKI